MLDPPQTAFISDACRLSTPTGLDLSRRPITYAEGELAKRGDMEETPESFVGASSRTQRSMQSISTAVKEEDIQSGATGMMQSISTAVKEGEIQSGTTGTVCEHVDDEVYQPTSSSPETFMVTSEAKAVDDVEAAAPTNHMEHIDNEERMDEDGRSENDASGCRESYSSRHASSMVIDEYSEQSSSSAWTK